MSSGAKLRSQLEALAANLWWTWNAPAAALFRDLDPAEFRRTNHNPRAMLLGFPPERFELLAADAALRARVDRIVREFHRYLERPLTWSSVHAAPLGVRPVAYLSAEFGVHESLPIYSGGLGVLAGDMLKSASDLGLAFVGVGLFYRESYFRQQLDREGFQHATYLRSPADILPAEPVRGPDGAPVFVEVPMTHGAIHAQVWQVGVGSVRLLLLDTDVEANREEDRQLAARLYYGDQRVRIRQEMLLGIGGVRALRQSGIRWGVLHMNEGHSAFAAFESTRQLMEATGADFHACAQEVAQTSVFTTHTPVDAGHDRFPPDLVAEHLEPLRESLGLDRETFLGLGRIRPEDGWEPFCMSVLAFKMSRYANAVSALHGRITRRSWQVLWPHHREDEVPVGHITNGVHVRSWIAPPMQELYDRYIGPGWAEHQSDPEMWGRIRSIPDAELWECHRALKADLVAFVRRRAGDQRTVAGYPPELVAAAETTLDPDALTIGFARRFSTYKRAYLLFHDMKRLAALLLDPRRPVQVVLAGKAHPADQPGQAILRRVHEVTLEPELRSRVVFVEDYDINVGRHLVQGVDVWLNNPRRPQEASGTSGQKALLNGGLNLSVLDGWWAEAYDGRNGFAIGDETVHVSPEEQDRRDAASLYETLEGTVVPLYYQRDEQDVPVGWVARMKRAIQTLGWRFNSDRMAIDYARECYLPAAGAVTSRMPK